MSVSETMPPPDKTGLGGRAWRCNLDAYRRTFEAAAADDATLAMWIVEAPWAHPFWHSYWITLVHLRPMPDERETKIYLEGATHEFWVYAVNADHSREPAIRGTGAVHHLTPPNFVAQFIEPSDGAACARIEGAVDLILTGELNPDTDARSQWKALFGDAMFKRRDRA